MILYQDQFIAEDDVSISYKDRGYYFGDGVYEVFRIYNNKLFAKEAHLKRLQRSALDTRINLPYPLSKIADLLEQLVSSEKIKEGTLYLQITRGAAARTHQFPLHAHPTLLAYCNKVDRPLRALQDGITAITLPDQRWLRCDLKTLNLLPNVLAKQAAVDAEANEAILHREGVVTEGSSSNLMMIMDNIMYTHPANNLILHGITRALVIKLAQQLDIKCKESSFTIDELKNADEVFITGTTVEITPVILIDGVPVGDGKPGLLTRKLQFLFEQTFV